MGLIASTLQNLSTNKEGEDIWDQAVQFAIPTGMTLFDVLNANFERDRNRNYTILNGGFQAKAYTLLGESSTGKSTLAIQWAAACVDFVNSIYPGVSDLVFFDIEKYFHYERIKQITGWTDKDVFEKLVLYHNEKTNIVDVFNEIKKICDLKEQKRKEVTITTPIYNLTGLPHHELAPTFVIIDSIAMLTRVPEFEHKKTGELYEEESMGQNTEAMRDALENTKFIKKVKPLLSKYNIILLMVNHITNDVVMSRYENPKKYLPFLKPGQKVVGGKELIYQSASIMEIVGGERLHGDKLKYGPEIHGSINKLTFKKNKNGFEGIDYPIVLSAAMGYMYELSDFELITEEKYGISGIGSYQLSILPEAGNIKKSNCYEKCQENPLLARAIQFTAKTYLIYTMVYRKDPPDLEALVEGMSYDDRIKMILAYTTSYPKYRHLDERLLAENIKSLRNSNYPFKKNIQNFFGNMAETIIDYYNKGYVYDPDKKVGFKDSLDEKRIIKDKKGRCYLNTK